MALKMFAAILTVALLAVTARVAEAQSDCVVQLVPCVDYLNSTSPPATCCNAIRSVVTTQLACLCGVYKNPALLQGINITQALELPRHCGISNDISACDNALAPGSSPPALPGGGNGNAAGRLSWIGIPALVVLSAFTFLY